MKSNIYGMIKLDGYLNMGKRFVMIYNDEGSVVIKLKISIIS